MKMISFIFLMLLSTLSFADIYEQVDEQGNVIYSDIPVTKHAVKIAAPNVTSTTPTTPTQTTVSTTVTQQPPSATSVTSAPVTKQPYTSFNIRSPANQTTLQNQPNFGVDLNIQPELQAGDQIQVFIDGKPWGDPLPSTHFELTSPERGIHQLSAVLMDSNGGVLKDAPPITIYVHQAHLGTTPKPLGSGI